MTWRFGHARAALAIVGAGAMTAGAHAQSAARPDQPDAIVCQLLSNCADASAGAADAPTPGRPRVSATRGFSLARPKATTGAAAVSAPTTMAVEPMSRAGQMASAKQRAKPHARVVAGQYDLNVLFLTGSDAVSPISRDRVSAFAAALRDPRLTGRRIRIEGHTDSVGLPDRNQDLSERRARAIADMLEASGIETARLDVRGYGSTQPLPGTSGRDGANRRVVAVLVQ